MSTRTRPPGVPPAWFMHTAWRMHRGLYRISGGRFLWGTDNKRGWGALHLTTTGRTSGLPREVIVGYLEDGPRLAVLAMNGWDEGHPSWFLNLQKDPDVLVRLPQGQPHSRRARIAEGHERERLWSRFATADPKLDTYAGSRSTSTPVVILDPPA
jgi:deazaflavin-dependent oxidoreductase (nitroreductase family)